MKAENRFYEVTPRILQAGREGEITIRPLYDHVRFAAGKPYTVHHFLMEDSPVAAKAALAGTYAVKPDRAGRLRFRSRFAGEQEHWIRVSPPAGVQAAPVDFRLFSLETDLFRRTPYKGDFHIHSNRSDGRESPAYVAAASRRIGLDFMAVTDHHRYAPSLEAIKAFAKIRHDLRIYPGEEVHPPEVPVHIINFGGRFSVNALFKTARYKREVERLRAEIAQTCPRGVDPFHAAACVWSFAKVREGGGLAVFCHPHWIAGFTYNVAVKLNDWMFERRPFDAYELIGGFHRNELESNQLQAGWYHEQRARGRGVPVVGASDAHGCERGELFGWYYTIVFSPSPDEVLASVRQGFSVAVEHVPGESWRPHGPFRLVKYALFLAREIFPFHDELCVEEGRLMAEYAAGHREAGTALARLNGRCASLYQRLWCSDGDSSK